MPERPEGARHFDEHFRRLYGERWEGLKLALQVPPRQLRRVNRFAEAGRAVTSWGPWIDPSCPEGMHRGSDDLLDAYVMDPASIVAAEALGVRPGDDVLDLCAAPGGKTLVLAEALAGRRTSVEGAAGLASGGSLVANELSNDRRERLIKVIRQYVPASWRESHVTVTGKDGTRYGLGHEDAFDRILVDAPCSGERHLLENPTELAEWSPRRTENLAIRQYSLLSSAFLCARVGGRIVYATCSISPDENDEVVARLLKKKKAKVRLLREFPSGVPADIAENAEQTEVGWRFLPDRGNVGPLYFAVVEKVGADEVRA